MASSTYLPAIEGTSRSDVAVSSDGVLMATISRILPADE